MTDDKATIDVAALTAPLHRALGEALSAFSGIESTLALIFARMIGSRDFDAALVAFDAINLTSPKIRVLRSLARFHLDRQSLNPEAEYARLNSLLKRVEARADFRVKLAHWTVSVWHPENMPITKFDEKITARLLPPWFSGKNLMFNPTESVSLEEIEQFRTKCHAVNMELTEYYMAMDRE